MAKRHRNSSFPDDLTTMMKRMRCLRVEPDWLDLLPIELIELILKKLGLVDIIRLKSVSQSWYEAANSYLWSHRNQSPWLMLPKQDNDQSHSYFINFAEQKRYKFNNIFQGLHKYHYRPRCVGSSYGWLIIFDDRSHGCLLNPFTRTKIELPSTIFLEFRGNLDDHIDVSKAILLSDPSTSSTKCFSIVIQFDTIAKIAFCTHKGDGQYKRFIRNRGDGEHKRFIRKRAWTRFGGFNYSDIMYHNNKLYALQYSTIVNLGEDNGIVEVWDFEDYFPKKVATFKPPLPLPMQDLLPIEWFPVSSDKIYSHIHLVESLGQILYVFMVSSSTSIDQDHLDQFFHVYKLLDHDGERWQEVENLKGQALFIGGNQSISVSAREFPEWKENSIYITSYFPHVRVYNMDEKVHKNIVKFSYLPPFWIVPQCF